MYNHVPVKLQPITATNQDGVRLYKTPEGNKYPSITTVLSVRSKKGIAEWRKRVGNDVANHISRTAANRGTKVHHMCEDYLNNQNIDHHKQHFLPYCLFSELRDNALTYIDNIYAQEAGLYSDKYKVAGRVDCIADYKGVPSIIDFKTSTKERKDEYNESYYIQGSAYAEMYKERTGVDISQVVILVVTEDGTVQEFIKQKHDYLDTLVETIAEWNNQQKEWKFFREEEQEEWDNQRDYSKSLPDSL